MTTPKVAIVGIDGVVSENGWRKNITDFNESVECSKNDFVFVDTLQMVISLHEAGWQIIGLTNRPERYRPLTTEWLTNNGVPMDELIMRPNDEYGSGDEVKLMLAKQRFGDELPASVRLVIDDREDVLALFAAEGVTTMLVNGRN